MTLTTAGIDFVTVRNDILTLLRANVATINSGLTADTITATTEQIVAGSPFIQTPMLFPCIMVKLSSKDEEFLSIGNAGRKRPTINFNIFCMTNKIENDPDAEMGILAKNVESIFRNNIEFSTKILYSDIGTGDFGDGEVNGVYCHIYRFTLACIVALE